MRDTLNSSNPNERDGHEESPKGTSFVTLVNKVFSTENIWAFLLFLIVVALIIFTTDSSPAWIYQGF